jgi:hypothetical protein
MPFSSVNDTKISSLEKIRAIVFIVCKTCSHEYTCVSCTKPLCRIRLNLVLLCYTENCQVNYLPYPWQWVKIGDPLSGVDPKPFRHRFQTGSGPYSASFASAIVAVSGHTATLAWSCHLTPCISTSPLPLDLHGVERNPLLTYLYSVIC